MPDTIVEPTLPIGFVLQNYEIQAVLGAGGFGITYLGIHRQLKKKVAIKEFMPRDYSYRDQSLDIRPNNSYSTSNKNIEIFNYGLKRFLTEAQDLCGFEHPHIVKAIDYFELHGTAYIVMEYARGQTLDRWLNESLSVPDESELNSIFLPLLDGLQEVHQKGLLHRDIKPDNIYIQDNGSPLLIDFGAARSAVGTRSRSWHVVVAEGFSPKEQYATAGRQGPWTDIYAVGATLLRCISSRVPAGAMDRLEALDNGEPDPILNAHRQFHGNYSEPFLCTIDHCLRIKGEDRPQNVREVRSGLLGTANVVNPADIATELRVSEPSVRSERLSWLPWVASPLVLMVVLGILYSSGKLETLLLLVGAESGGFIENSPELEIAESSTSVITSQSSVISEKFESALARVKEADRILRELGSVVTDSDKRELNELRSRADSLGSQLELTSATELLNQVHSKLKDLQQSSHRFVKIGSTSTEINDAFLQCEAYYGRENCAPSWYEAERASSVVLKPFALDPREVSFAQFADFVKTSDYITDAERRDWSLQLMSNFDVKTLKSFNWRQPEGPSSSWEKFRDQPVVHVSQNDAQNYCKANSGRLPTRSEWEYIASTIERQLFASYFNKDTYRAVNVDEPTLSSVSSNSSLILDARSKIYGLTGNVAEWTSTIDASNSRKYYVKGGSWKDAAVVNLRISSLRPEYPDDSYIDLGFRCAQQTERWP